VTRAAVLAAPGQRLVVHDDLEMEAPRAGEVAVRMVAAGVCHSDLSARQGDLLVPTPVVLGHEGAGVVVAAGAGVDTPRIGDHVVVGWLARCGRCFWCAHGQAHLCDRATTALAAGSMPDGTTRLRRRGAAVHQMSGAGTFADAAVVPAAATVAVPRDLAFEVAALLGCAVATGVGAALRTARVEPGSTAVVVGCGGVGLNVVQGARLAGAGRIVAVDTRRPALALAEAMGATDVVDAGAGDPVAAVMALTGQRGADVAFEVVGRQATIDQALAMARRGGQVVLVGIPTMDATVALPAFLGLVLSARTVTGCWSGSWTVADAVPELVAHHRAGRLRLAELVTATVGLEEVDAALDRLPHGAGGRTVVRFS